jgi:iron complex outermembrane receptor protein
MTKHTGRSARTGVSRAAGALFLSTALVSVVGVATAHAEEVAAKPPVATELGEVLVTARKRSENLQTTPVSASVISSVDAQEQNIRNFQDLRGVVSNLELVPQDSGGTTFTIRGIGQTSGQVNVDSKAGFYVDEMYVARQEGNQLYFYDIDSFQVLKGPQGTLFGKNTTAGAVLLTTKRPTADEGGYLLARLGNYRRFDTEGAVNIPLSDTLLTRFSFRTDNARGFIKHVLDDDRSNNVNDQSARFQVRVLPNEKLTIDLLGEYGQMKTDGSTTIATSCNPNAAYILDYNALHSQKLCDSYPVLNQGNLVYGGATLTVPTSAVVTDTAHGGDATGANLTRHGHRSSFNDTEVATANMRVNYELNDDVSLKSISGYRRSESSWYNPTLNAPNDIYAEYDKTETDQFTQEFNVTGKALDGRLNYVVGAYYSYQSTKFLQDTGPDWIDPLGYVFDASNTFKSWAAYAQSSMKVTDKLEITVGGRYSYDKKKANSFVFFSGTCGTKPFTGYVNYFVANFIGGTANCAGAPFTGADQDHWGSFDPRAQISYAWSNSLYSYLSVTKGYNAGGFNQQLGNNALAGKLLPYDPEKVVSYEAGLKSEWLDRRLRANLSVFYQKYSDIQTTVLVTIAGIDTRQVQTGATAHEQGVEGELILQPTPELTLRASGSYLDQKYDSVRPGVAFITIDTPVDSAPKYTYSLSGNYSFHLPSDSILVASLNWRAVGKKPKCNPIGSCYLPAYGILGGRLDFQPGDDGPWSISVFGANLLNKTYQLNRTSGSGFGIGTYAPGRPREFGVEVRRTF